MTELFEGTSGPLPQGTRITQPFGYDPTYPGNAQHVHYGVDFGVYYVPTTAPCAYTVDIAGWWQDTGYGNVVLGYYDDPDGTRWWLLAAHLSEVHVYPGQVVRRGQVVGITGNSGYSTGAHLHFARGRNGHDNAHWEDPLPWLLSLTPPEEDVDEATTRRIAKEEAAAAVEAYNTAHYNDDHQFLAGWKRWGQQPKLMDLISNFWNRLTRFAPGWPPAPEGKEERNG